MNSCLHVKLPWLHYDDFYILGKYEHVGTIQILWLRILCKEHCATMKKSYYKWQLQLLNRSGCQEAWYVRSHFKLVIHKIYFCFLFNRSPSIVVWICIWLKKIEYLRALLDDSMNFTNQYWWIALYNKCKKTFFYKIDKVSTMKVWFVAIV